MWCLNFLVCGVMNRMEYKMKNVNNYKYYSSKFITLTIISFFSTKQTALDARLNTFEDNQPLLLQSDNAYTYSSASFIILGVVGPVVGSL